MAKERFISEKELVKHLPVFVNKADGSQFTEEQLDRIADIMENQAIIQKAKELDTDRPSKEDVEVALKTIGDLAVLCSLHGLFREPVPGLVKTTEWLKKQFAIRG